MGKSIIDDVTKDLGNIFSPILKCNPFLEELTGAFGKKDPQKQIAENTAKILTCLQENQKALAKILNNVKSENLTAKSTERERVA